MTECLREQLAERGIVLGGPETEEHAHISDQSVAATQRWEDMPWAGLSRVAALLAIGRQKHGAGNWRKGLQQTVWVSRAASHVARFFMGFRDEDHLACAAANLLFAIEMESTHPHWCRKVPNFRPHDERRRTVGDPASAGPMPPNGGTPTNSGEEAHAVESA